METIQNFVFLFLLIPSKIYQYIHNFNKSSIFSSTCIWNMGPFLFRVYSNLYSS